MVYDFDELINRRNTYSLKWDHGDLIKTLGYTERYDNDTIPLFTADMDFAVPECLIKTLHEVVEHRIFGYSYFTDEYYEAIQQWFYKRHNWAIKKEHIVYSPGTVHALGVAVKAFTEPGDGVIIQRPVYPPFTMAIEKNGREVINNALIPNNDGYYEIDFEDFEKKAKVETTRLFILCNPHNPTGRIFSITELQKLAKICEQNNVIIIADEIHGDLIRKNKTFIPICKVVDNDHHIVTLTAINKTFNTAGLHCTNAVITNPILKEKFTLTMGMQLPSPFTIAALISVYTNGEEWLEQLKAYIDDTMYWIIGFLKEKMPKVKVWMPEGTYVMWLDFNGYDLSSDEVHDRIYNKANVLLEDGKIFGKEGLVYQRICVSSPRATIKTALERIAKEFEDIQ